MSYKKKKTLSSKYWFVRCQDSSLSWQGTVCYNWSKIASLYMWISVPLLCLRGKLWDRKHHCGFGRGSRLFSFLWAVTSSDTVEKSFSLDSLCSEPCLLVCGSLLLKRTLRNYGWKVSPSFHVSLCRWVFGADRCGDLQDQVICELYAVTFRFAKFLTLFYIVLFSATQF